MVYVTVRMVNYGGGWSGRMQCEKNNNKKMSSYGWSYGTNPHIQ